MDQESEKPGRSGREGRSSLVERAAERLASLRDSKETTGPAPTKPAVFPAPPQDEPGSGAGAAEAPDISEALEGGETLIAEALEETAVPLAAAPGNQKEAARRGVVRSRSVKIDLERLASRNILTPATKRNRTVEELRLIKRMVLSRRWEPGDAPGNTILVTSALPSEGKTTTAINLAMSIAAEEDLRVLLVDADFVKPDAMRQLGVSANKGLIDVLEDPSADISDVILNTDVGKLSLIPSGHLHDRCTELLASARMDDLITELSTRYEDRILIFDSPPVLATTESVTLASHMGQVVFVVQAGRTRRESVDSALELLGERQHLGLVLNRASPLLGKSGFGAYYGSYYYGYGNSGEG